LARLSSSREILEEYIPLIRCEHKYRERERGREGGMDGGREAGRERDRQKETERGG
jgi:hypothetical protein